MVAPRLFRLCNTRPVPTPPHPPLTLFPAALEIAQIRRIRGQCWWKGGPENELEFSLTEVRLGPFKFSKSKDQVKTYKFFANDQKVGCLGGRLRGVEAQQNETAEVRKRSVMGPSILASV